MRDDPGYAQRIAATRPPAGAVWLYWIGQAGFVIRGSTTTLVIDPYLVDRPDRTAPPPLAPGDLGFADAVLATHEHRDHLDLVNLPAVAAAAPAATFVVPEPLVQRTAEAVGSGRVIGALPGTPIVLDSPGGAAGAATGAAGPVTIMPVPACHGVHVADAYSFGLAPGEHRYLGYVVTLDGLRIYHAGDTIRYDGMAERLRELGVQVALLPVNGRDATREARDLVGNLTEEEAAELVRDAGIAVAVPMHYELFAHNAGSAGTFADRVAALAPSATVLVPGRYTRVLVSVDT